MYKHNSEHNSEEVEIFDFSPKIMAFLSRVNPCGKKMH